jgi:phosphatidylserine/phosphatidylglycerophosphate/cardiolipin synthase-like enzyme
LYQLLAALGRQERFTLAGVAVPQSDGTQNNIYVHDKIMLVDDAFATIGSCNIRARSFFDHTEMNASIYDPMVVRALRRELFAEHLNRDTEALDDVAALRLYAETARANAHRRQSRHAAWQGTAFALEPATYAA